MTHPDHDPIIAGLAGLTADAPDGLLERIVARRARVPARIGDALPDLQVAFPAKGSSTSAPARTTRRSPPGSAPGSPARCCRPTGRRPDCCPRCAREGWAGCAWTCAGSPSSRRRCCGRHGASRAGRRARTRGWPGRRAARARRAAGSALGRNPLPLLIPCHRVTRADGTVGQYVFGGVAKEALLRAENVNLDEVAALAREGVFFLGSDTTGVVCFPTCHNARRITPAHRYGFATVAAAAAAGYRPCRHCRPGLAETA